MKTKKEIFEKYSPFFKKHLFDCDNIEYGTFKCGECPWNIVQRDTTEPICDYKAYDEFEKYNKLKEILK